MYVCIYIHVCVCVCACAYMYVLCACLCVCCVCVCVCVCVHCVCIVCVALPKRMMIIVYFINSTYNWNYSKVGNFERPNSPFTEILKANFWKRVV